MFLAVHDFFTFGRVINGFARANARRRISLDQQGPTVVHQKPGPLQTIFHLLPDEVNITLLLLRLVSSP